MDSYHEVPEDLPSYDTPRVKKLKEAYRRKPSKKLEELLKREYLRELYERLNN